MTLQYFTQVKCGNYGLLNQNRRPIIFLIKQEGWIPLLELIKGNMYKEFKELQLKITSLLI
jgi:hypothetical protein